MSFMPKLPSHPLAPAARDRECGQDHCDRGHNVAVVEYKGTIQRLCRTCRKDLWRVSS